MDLNSGAGTGSAPAAADVKTGDGVGAGGSKSVDEVGAGVSTASELDSVPAVTYTSLFRYASPFEKLLLVLGVVGGCCSGACMPLFAIIFGCVGGGVGCCWWWACMWAVWAGPVRWPVCVLRGHTTLGVCQSPYQPRKMTH